MELFKDLGATDSGLVGMPKKGLALGRAAFLWPLSFLRCQTIIKYRKLQT